jgi:hypothetical protein
VTGAAGATLRNCVVSLADDDDRSAAVTVGGMDEMRKDPADRAGPGPQVRLENTLIRGHGKGVSVTTGHGFGLELTTVMTALDGPLVAMDALAKDTPASERGRVSLARVTVAAAGPLLDLHSGRSGPLPIDVTADRCVFAPVGPARPLIRIDGGDPAAIDRYLTWQADGPNLYANFDRSASLLEIRPADEATATPVLWDAVDWVRFAKEGGKVVGKARFANWPDNPRNLAAVVPSDLRLTDLMDADLSTTRPGAVGADAEAIPKPWDD